MADVIWASSSKLKAWFDCARRAYLEKFVTNAAIEAGSARHGVVESHYTGTTPKPGPYLIEATADVERSIARGLLPPKDQVVSVEGSDLPKEYATVAYDRKMFKVLVTEKWGVRGAADLCVIPDDEGDVFLIVDWKSRSQSDGEIQGSVYALAYSIMFPGFHTYRFEQRSLTGSWANDRYDFIASDMPKVQAFIETLVFAMDADTEHAPKENAFCSYCTVSADCPVYQKMVSAPIVETLPAVKTFNLPIEFGPLLELKEKAATYEKIAEALKDRCQDELLKILAHGPVKQNGHVYTRSSGTSGYAPKDGRLTEIIQTLEKAGLSTPEFFVLDTPRVREALDRAAKKSVVNAEQDAIKAVIKDCFEAKTYPKISRKAG